MTLDFYQELFLINKFISVLLLNIYYKKTIYHTHQNIDKPNNKKTKINKRPHFILINSYP